MIFYRFTSKYEFVGGDETKLYKLKTNCKPYHCSFFSFITLNNESGSDFTIYRILIIGNCHLALQHKKVDKTKKILHLEVP